MENIKQDDWEKRSSNNGYDVLYNSQTYKDYVMKRRRPLISSNTVMFFSLDIVGAVVFLGIVQQLGGWAKILLSAVPILYMTFRFIMFALKSLVWLGRNKKGLKDGIDAAKDIFND